MTGSGEPPATGSSTSGRVPRRTAHSARPRGLRRPGREVVHGEPEPSRPADNKEGRTAFKLAIVGIVGTLLAGVLGGVIQSNQSTTEFQRTEQKAADSTFVTDITKVANDTFRCDVLLPGTGPIPSESVADARALQARLIDGANTATQDAFVVDIVSSREASELATKLFSEYSKTATDCNAQLQSKLDENTIDPNYAAQLYTQLQNQAKDISDFLTQARKDLGSN